MHTLAKPLSFKFAAGSQGRFTGIASSFSTTPDRQGDIVRPGAYRATLAAWEARGARLPLLWNHDPAEPIGAVLSARETPEGLEVEGQLAQGVGNAERAFRLLETGGLSMSIGFTIPVAGARLRDDGIRELIAVDLAEISLVAIPADPRAVVRAIKSSPRDFETAAREALGLSAREAKRLTAGGYAALVRDEPADDAEQLRKAAEADAERITHLLNRIANFKGTP